MDKTGIECQHIIGTIKKAIRTTNQLTTELRPLTLKSKDLVTSLKDLTKSTAVLKNLEVSFHNNSLTNFELRDEIQLAIFRITQEALNNAHRNHKIKQVILQLHVSTKSIFYTIENSGQGENQEDTIEIKNIINRVTAIGGMIEIHNIPEKGTLLSIEIDR